MMLLGRCHRKCHAAVLVSLLLLYSYSIPTVAAGDDVELWYEVQPSTTRYDEDLEWQHDKVTPNSLLRGPLQSAPRRLYWHGRVDEEATWKMHPQESHSSLIHTSNEPHPLRTNLWTLDVRWTRKYNRRLQSPWGRNLEMDFDEATKKCLARVGDKVVGLGRWEVFPWGLWFNLKDANGEHEYSCFSQLLLNPFGSQAKLVQGSILLYSKEPGENALIDMTEEEEWMLGSPKKKWFRPVVGRFSARGIGRDTADFSYKKRAIGLSS